MKRKNLLLSAHQGGMTLLELLVTMLLLAMAATLLIQGLSTALQTYERVQRKLSTDTAHELAYRWMAQTISGTQAELDKLRHFQGSSLELKGYTHRPLVGSPGQVSAYRWVLTKTAEDHLALHYQQNEDIDWQVMSWPQNTRARFMYRSPQGEPLEQWPPQDARSMTTSDGNIPAALLLEITEGTEQPTRWYFNLPTRSYPRADYRDF